MLWGDVYAAMANSIGFDIQIMTQIYMDVISILMYKIKYKSKEK